MSLKIVFFALLLTGSMALRILSRESKMEEQASQDKERDRDFKVMKVQESQLNNLRQKLNNPYGSWSCGGSAKENGKYSNDGFLKSNGNTWPKELFETMLNKRMATRFWDGKNGPVSQHDDSTVKFCETQDVESRFKSVFEKHDAFKTSKQMILDASKSIPMKKDEPVVFIDADTSSNAAIDTLSNSLCALRRVGLLSRTLVYSQSKASEQTDSLKSMFPEVVIVLDPQIKNMLHEVDGVGNKLRWIPVLHLLDFGYTVLHLDSDNHVISDPLPLLHSAEKADVGFAYEGCLAFNGGTNFFRPTEPAKRMIHTLLALQTPRLNGSLVMPTGDQSFIECAVAHAVVKFNLQVHVIPKSKNAFHWGGVSEAFKQHCYDGDHSTVQDFPTFMHTSGTSTHTRKRNMKLLGLWELKEPTLKDASSTDGGGGVCVENFDPVAKCKKGISVAQKDLTQHLYQPAWVLNASEMDVIMPLHNPSCVTGTVITQLNKHFGPRRVIVFTASSNCPLVSSLASNVLCLDEELALPGWGKQRIADRLGTFQKKPEERDAGFGGHTTPGWYLQQMIKLGAQDSPLLASNSVSDTYLIWDADLIMLKDFPAFSTDGHMQLTGSAGSGCIDSYRSSYKKLTGADFLSRNHGYVSHHMVMHKPFVTEMLHAFAQEGKDWHDQILRASCEDHPEQCFCGFSEYESMADWNLRHHQNAFVTTFPHLERLTPDSSEACCPTEEFLVQKAESHDMLGLERGKCSK